MCKKCMIPRSLNSSRATSRTRKHEGGEEILLRVGVAPLIAAMSANP